MVIQIGDREFATERPADLDAQLLAQTGCNETEAKRWLKGTPVPGHVAMALRPWLVGDELPTMAELGEMIAEAGTVDVANQLADLYDPPQPEPWARPAVDPPSEPEAVEPPADEESHGGEA